MSCDSPRAARPWPAANARRAPIPAVRAGGLSECGVAAALRGDVPACMVDMSVSPGTGGRRAGRGADGGRNGQPSGERPARWRVPLGRQSAGAKGAEFRFRSRERGAVHSEGDKGNIPRQMGRDFGGKRGSVIITGREPVRRVGPANGYTV